MLKKNTEKKKHQLFRRTISGELIIGIIISLTVILSSIGIGMYYTYKSYLYYQLEQDASSQKERLTEVLSFLVWNYDKKNIELVLNGYLESGVLGGVYLSDSDNNQLFKSLDEEKKYYSIKKSNIIKDGEVLGQLELYFSDIYLQNTLNSAILSFTILILASIIITALTISILVKHSLHNPLKKLLSGITEISEGSYSSYLSSVPQYEINKIIEAVKMMSAQILRREKSMQESEKKYKNIFDNANDAIFYMSHDKFIDCNKKTLEIFGCTKDQIIGQPPYFFSPETQPDGSTSKDAALKYITAAINMEPQLFDWKHCRYDRTTFDAEVSLNAVKLENEDCILAIVRDVTAKMKAVELTIAAETAKEASKAKGEFLANMSHEIRTPMNAILGLAHLALQTKLTSTQYDYLRKIEISGKSLLGIINDILDFSKIEAGKLKIENINFDLEEVMTNVSTVISVKAVEKPEIEVLFDIEPIMPCRLVGDPLRLGQVLINLCNNALKFTERGEVIVKARLLEDKGELVVLEFSVEDTGIGLTEEQQSKLFQSFNQADSSITRKYGGTGLGLSISKKLVELMNGEIKVESKIGEGSTFSFYVVLGKQDRPHIERNLPLNMTGTKTLVVDDCEVSRVIIKKTLESFSFKVTCASSGKEALELLENEPADDPYELVLMDWKMPHMDGLEAISLMKEKNKNPKFILVTAYDREEILEKSEKIGLDGHITKPFTGSILFDAIIESFADGPLKNIGLQRGRDTAEDDIKGIIGAKVLLVEDNEINQQIAIELLQQMYLDIMVANDGIEAVDKAKENDFDIILMDIQMPKMSGLEATKLIRNSYTDHQSKTPIVAMTAHAMAGDAEKSLAVGMNDHITKPIDPAKLRKTLIKWIPHGNRKVPELYIKKRSRKDSQNRPVNFPGIAIEKGLKNVNNNKDLYYSLLKKFYYDNLATTKNIDDALIKGDNALSARLAHTCKGVSGSIGAQELYRLSDMLENAILDEDQKRIKDTFGLFELKLKDVLNGLADFATEKKETLSQKNGSKELFNEMLVQLKDATKVRKLSASKKIVKDLKSYIWTDDYAKNIIKICEAVDKYDFKTAHNYILEALGADE